MKLFSVALVVLLNSAITGAKVRPSRELVKLEEDCTAEVSIHESGDSTVDDWYELACETSNGLYYTVPVDQEFIEDNLIDGPYEPGSTKMSFPGGAMINPNTAEIITPDVHPRLTHDTSKGGPKVNVVGEYDFLVVRIVANDDANSLSEAELTDAVFGTNGDPVNLKSQYGLCSHGKNIVNKSPDRTGNSTNISQGVVTITVDVNTTEGHKVIRKAVTDEINAQFNVSHPRDITDHALYCMPPNTMNGLAYAFLNSWMSVYRDTWCRPVSAQMHEVGHNLGLHHSNEDGEYKDQSCMMGFSYGGNDMPQMCFNSAKGWQLGWYVEKELLLGVGGDGQYWGELAGIIEDVDDPTVPPMIVKINSDTVDDYFLFFNRKDGFTSGTKEGGDTVMIVQQGKEGLGTSKSELLAKLNVGENWTSPEVIDGESVSVTVEAISDRADVLICVGTCNFDPTASPAPSICSECPEGLFELQIDIKTDDSPGETDWTVTNSTGSVLMSGGDYGESNKLYSSTDCISDGDYTFSITDSFGDGICCSSGDGYFEGYVNGELEFSGGDFGSSDSRVFSGERPCGPDPPVCVDSPLLVSPFAADCAFVGANSFCGVSGAKEHCPLTCNGCDEFACADSAVQWFLANGNFNCAQLAGLEEAEIENYCDLFPELSATCRSTCKFCAE